MRWISGFLFYALLQAAPIGAPVKGTITLPEGAVQKKTRLDPKYSDESLAAIKKDPDPSFAVVWLEKGPASVAKDKIVEMKQTGLEFRPRVLAIQTGTTVRFLNADVCQHHVASYSKTKKFDAGRVGEKESFDATFEKVGKVELICEIHPHMKGFIIVVDNPHFAVCDKDGRYEIPGVPEGKWTVAVWHEDFGYTRRDVEVKAGGLTFDLELPAK